jgi:hypothetical protein
MQHPLEQEFSLETEILNNNNLDIEHVDDGEYMAVEAVNVPATTSTPVAPVNNEPDEEDKVINSKIDDIYSEAMNAYQNQTAYVEILEPRYAARNAEVAAGYLNTALNAVALRAKVKNERKKVANGFVPFANQTTNNVVVADRNELLRMFDEKPINGN